MYADSVFCYADKEVEERFILSGGDERNNLEIRVQKEELEKLNSQISSLLELEKGENNGE